MKNKLIIAAVPVLLGVALTFAVWAMDQKYITYTAFEQFQQQQYTQRLGDQIDQLTLKEGLGMASEFEKALLKQLKEKLNREN